MHKDKLIINDDFTTIGGHNKPPKKKKSDKDKDDDKNKTKIPQSENDVDGLTYIEEG